MAFWWGLGSIFSVCLIGPFAIFLAVAALRNARRAELEVHQGRITPSDIPGAKSGRILAWCAIVFAIGHTGLIVTRMVLSL